MIKEIKKKFYFSLMIAITIPKIKKEHTFLFPYFALVIRRSFYYKYAHMFYAVTNRDAKTNTLFFSFCVGEFDAIY